MQRVKRVKEQRAFVSYVIFSKSQRCSNKETPIAPKRSTLTLYCGGLSARPREALIGRAAYSNIQSDTLLGVVIGRSRCSYVNEHLVAPAGPGCGARTEAEAREWVSEWVRGRDAETQGSWTLSRCYLMFPPHCQQVLQLFISVWLR